MGQPENIPEASGFPEMRLRSVGVVRNGIREPSWVAGLQRQDWREKAQRAREDQKRVSEMVIDSDLDGVLDGLEDFSHLLVLYWPHLISPERRFVTRVHPTGREDFPLVGVFATRSPARPNTILATVVKLLEREGNVLRVTGLDAVDGSPVLDIKPYVPCHHDVGEVRMPAWMAEIRKEFTEV
jgi:tRNA-Thr(GGU) m(6)t(6)A37 methyltransferase TsaA